MASMPIVLLEYKLVKDARAVISASASWDLFSERKPSLLGVCGVMAIGRGTYNICWQWQVNKNAQGLGSIWHWNRTLLLHKLLFAQKPKWSPAVCRTYSVIAHERLTSPFSTKISVHQRGNAKRETKFYVLLEISTEITTVKSVGNFKVLVWDAVHDVCARLFRQQGNHTIWKRKENRHWSQDSHDSFSCFQTWCFCLAVFIFFLPNSFWWKKPLNQRESRTVESRTVPRQCIEGTAKVPSWRRKEEQCGGGVRGRSNSTTAARTTHMDSNRSLRRTRPNHLHCSTTNMPCKSKEVIGDKSETEWMVWKWTSKLPVIWSLAFWTAPSNSAEHLNCRFLPKVLSTCKCSS